jgi:hypothetical protein
MTRKYTQAHIDQMFNHMINSSQIEFPEDCERICKAIKTYRGRTISASEAHLFWIKRSELYDASWLSLPKLDEILLKDWDKFVDDWYADNDPN